MPDAGVVAEFLAKLGFDVDESSMKAFKYSLGEATKSVGELGLAMTSVSLAVADGMKRITDQFAGLHYFSQRTGTTVQNLQDMAYAAQQAGGSADAMGAAVKRTYDLMQLPGGAGIGMMRTMGGVTGPITSARQALQAEMGHWAQMYKNGQIWGAQQQEGALGYDPESLDPILRNWDTFLAKQKEAGQHISDMGLDPDKFADDSAKMQRSWNQLSFDIKLSGQAFAADWVKPVTEGIDAVTTLIEKLQVDFSHFDLQERRKFEAAAIPVAALGLTGMAALALKTFRGVFGLEGGAGIFGRVFGAGVRGGLVGGALGALGMGVDPIPEYNPSGQPGAGWTPPPGYEAPLDRLWQWLNRPGPAAAPGATAPALPSPAGAPLGMSWTIPTKSFFHKESYDPGGDDELIPSGRPNPLLQSAAFRPQSDAESDLRDWLHGSSAYTPAVRITGAGGVPLSGADLAPLSGLNVDLGAAALTGAGGPRAGSLAGSGTGAPLDSKIAAQLGLSGLPPQAQALLAGIAGGEAKGFNELVGGGTFSGYGGFPSWGGHAGSHAAGLFQDEPSTWAAIARGTGAKDFGPQAQIAGNWWWAQKTYRTASGRDLLTDLRSGKLDQRGRSALYGQWPGGFNAGWEGRYRGALGTLDADEPSSGHDADRARFPPWIKYNSKGESYSPDLDHLAAATKAHIEQSMWAIKHTRWADDSAYLSGAHLAPSVTNHHAGDKHVTINQAPMNVTVHGSAADAAKHLGNAHSRALQDAVRNVTPLLQ